MREYYEKICAGEQVRANLIALREELKDEKAKRSFAYLLGGDFQVLCSLLKADDPKVRKNAALILGQMESEDLLPVLFDAYKNEETLFIKADYLKAISEMEYKSLVRQLEERLEQLRRMPVLPEEEKHVSAELRMLQTMVLKYKKPQMHKFIGESVHTDFVLITNRCQREVTARQITEGQIAMLAGGVRVKNGTVESVLPIRTWSEMLFPIAAAPLDVKNPGKTGRLLAGRVLDMAQDLHQGSTPFLFRIELKGIMSPEKKGAYIRKISDAMQKEAEGKLINSTSDYELEIRLLERKDGTFLPMLKLFTIPDRRFVYRQESIASSIAPVNAALTAALAKPYLKESGQVLDPFCGVGTMLAERSYVVRAGSMYGIDIFGQAIDKARKNLAHAGIRAYFVNKDFFDFEHEYLFDEVITDLPQVTASRPKEEIRELYLRFFARVGDCLKEDAVLVLYATEPQFVLEGVRRQPEYRIAEKYILNEKNGTAVFILCRGKAGKRG